MVNFVKNSNHTYFIQTHTHTNVRKKNNNHSAYVRTLLWVDSWFGPKWWWFSYIVHIVACSSSSFHFQFFNFCSILHNIIFSCWFLFSFFFFYFNSFEVIIIIIVTAVWIAQKAFKSTKQLHHLIVTFVYSLSIKHICTAWLFAGALWSRVIVSLLQ